MRTKLETVLNEIKDLELEELEELLENVSQQLRYKTGTVKFGVSGKAIAAQPLEIPGTYQFSPAEIEAHLAAVFTPEQLAEMERTDSSNLSKMSRTSTEILSEDREDRF